MCSKNERVRVPIPLGRDDRCEASFHRSKVSPPLSPPVDGIWSHPSTPYFDEQKTSFLSVSLDALKIHFRIFIFSDFFATKNIFFVFHALKIIIFRVSIKPVFQFGYVFV